MIGGKDLPVISGIAGDFIIEFDILGDGNLLGAVRRTVAAAGAANGGFSPDDFSNFRKKSRFFCGQRFKGLDIALYLLHSTHAA